MSFGKVFPDTHQWAIGPDETREVIARALDLGINFIDTANVYAHGTSEEYIGSALQSLGVRREDVVLASKVYYNEGKLSREAILREVDSSLRRLQTDYLDLYIIHRFDYDTPMEETMSALDSLVKSGKVRALGASAMYGYQFHNLQEVAAKNGWTQFTSMQNHYNLLYREDERELIPVTRQYDVALTPYSPLASGHLTRPTWESGSVRDTTDATYRAKYEHAKANDMQVVTRVAEVANKRNIPMSHVALAWLWGNGAASTLVGCSKPKRVEDAVAALEVKLTPDEIAYLEEPYVPHEIVGAI